jgi:hypothetical protein
MHNLAVQHYEEPQINKLDEPFSGDISNLLEPISGATYQKPFYVINGNTGDIYGTEQDYRNRVREILAEHFPENIAEIPKTSRRNPVHRQHVRLDELDEPLADVA